MESKRFNLFLGGLLLSLFAQSGLGEEPKAHGGRPAGQAGRRTFEGDGNLERVLAFRLSELETKFELPRSSTLDFESRLNRLVEVVGREAAQKPDLRKLSLLGRIERLDETTFGKESATAGKSLAERLDRLEVTFYGAKGGPKGATLRPSLAERTAILEELVWGSEQNPPRIGLNFRLREFERMEERLVAAESAKGIKPNPALSLVARLRDLEQALGISPSEEKFLPRLHAAEKKLTLPTTDKNSPQ